MVVAEDVRKGGEGVTLGRAALTPGTELMAALETAVMGFARKCLKQNASLEVVVSGASVPVRAPLVLLV